MHEKNKQEKYGQTLIIFLIMIIGLTVRFIDLGRQSYWYDESAEATAGSMHTIAQVVELSRYHTGAMPLDYIIVWILGHVSLEESWLRIAPASWGVASILILYFLANKITGKTAALITSGLFALSPIHIYFSQELRYYSALIFFYWLITLTLYRAIEDPTWRNWILVTIASILGAYFHMFAIFAWLNACVFWGIRYKFSFRYSKLNSHALVTIFLISLFVVPGLVIFGSENRFSYPLNTDLLASQIFIAFGWLPANYSIVGFILGFSLFIATIFGLIISIRQKKYLLLGMALVTAIEIIAIIIAAIRMGYFFSSRQFIFILPITFIFVGFAIHQLFLLRTSLFSAVQSNFIYSRINQFMALLIVSGLIFASLFNYLNDFQYEKSSARKISYQLAASWHPGDTICTIPYWDQYLYQFYFNNLIVNKQISDTIKPISWDDLSRKDADSGKVFLLTEAITNPEEWKIIQQSGFHLISDINAPNLLWAN